MSNFSDDGWDSPAPTRKAVTNTQETGNSFAFGQAKPVEHKQQNESNFNSAQQKPISTTSSVKSVASFGRQNDPPKTTTNSSSAFGRMPSSSTTSSYAKPANPAPSIDCSEDFSQNEALEITQESLQIDDSVTIDDSQLSDDEWGPPGKAVDIKMVDSHGRDAFEKFNVPEKKPINLPPSSFGGSKPVDSGSHLGARSQLSPPSIAEPSGNRNAGFGRNDVRKMSEGSDDGWDVKKKDPAPSPKQQVDSIKPQGFGNIQKETERVSSFVQLAPASGSRSQAADQSRQSYNPSPMGFGPDSSSSSSSLKPQGFGLTKEPAESQTLGLDDSNARMVGDDTSSFGCTKWSPESSLFNKSELLKQKQHNVHFDESIGADSTDAFGSNSTAGFGEPRKKEPVNSFGGNSTSTFGNTATKKESTPFDSTFDTSTVTSFGRKSFENTSRMSDFGGGQDDGFGKKDDGFGSVSGTRTFGFGPRSSNSARNEGFGSRPSRDTDSTTEERRERPKNDNCRNCNQPGHFAKDCENPSVCGYCREEGHKIAECTSKPPMMCYNCQQEGHRSTECQNEPVARVPTEPCFRCSETGHWSKDCPTRPRDADGNIIPPYEMKLVADEELFENVSDNVRQIDDDQDVTLSRGQQKLRRIETFEEFKELPAAVLKNLKRMQFTRPTKIQQASFYEIFNGKDVVASAHTGCGKTLAFLLPLVTKLLKEDWSDDGIHEEIASPRLLIIAPTRELAAQTYLTVRQVSYDTGLTASIVYGGTSRSGNLQNLLSHKKLSILVATMGRLNDFIESSNITLSKLKYVVLDEADRMVDVKDFGEQVNKMLGTPDERPSQVCLFSASFSNALQLEDLPKVVKGDYAMIDVNKFGTANENISQFVIPVARADKMKKLFDLLEIDENNYSTTEDSRVKKEKTLIFVNSLKFADTLAASMGQAGLPVISMHSNHNQQQRETILSDFRKGKYNVMVASNVCARGLNISKLDHVINYDMPNKEGFDEYVNRIGRTGRAGFNGVSTAFYCEDSDSEILDALYDVIKEANKEVPDWLEEAKANRGNVVVEEDEDEQW